MRERIAETEPRLGRGRWLRRLATPCFLMLLVAALLPGCGDEKNDNGGTTGPVIRHPEDFLPPGTEGMAKDGTSRVATDTAELQEIVNGGYEVYTNNGFEEMVEQYYSGTVGETAATIRLRIFDVGSSENAAALHDELLQAGTWEEAGEVGDQDHRQSSLFAYTILFRRGQYSSELQIGTSSQDAKDLVLLFAAHIDQEIDE